MPETSGGSQPAWMLHFRSHEGMIHMIISVVCKEARMGRITQYYHATSLEDAFAKAKQLGPVAAYVGGGVELVLRRNPAITTCLLYTSDAADDLLCVDLGGRRIIKKK